jgi:hypothetical protein
MLQEKTRAIDKFREGGTWEQAAMAAGISRMTLWRWAKADPEFAQAIQEARAGPDDEVEAVAFANAIDPDPAHNGLRMFWLKARRPSVYRERLDVTTGEKSFGFIERAENPRDSEFSPPDQAE